MWRTDSLEKTVMLGKTEGGRTRGRQRMKWLDGTSDSMDMSLSKLQRSWWWTGMLQSMGSQRVGHDWSNLAAAVVLHIRWPKYWSFSFSISPSNEYSGLISFRMDWLDLLAVQRTLASLLQHHSSKASILQCSAFFIVQLSHPYMTTGKTTALPRWTFVSKVMSLLFNMLSSLVIAFLPRSKRLLISWLQSPFAVILESQKIVPHCFHCYPIYLRASISKMLYCE